LPIVKEQAAGPTGLRRKRFYSSKEARL